MIVDTSALIAVVKHDKGWSALLDVLLREIGQLPTPVLVEFHRVAMRSPDIIASNAEATLAKLLAGKLRLLPFTPEHARAAAAANEEHGIGNGRGGTLNMLDLMVFGVAQVSGEPILCTGADFAKAGAALHPASLGDAAG